MKKRLMCRHISLVAFSLLLAWPAAAFDLPARKPGLWQMTMKFEKVGFPSPPQIVQQCIDAATDKEMNAYGSTISTEMCSKQDTQKIGEKIIVDQTCQIGAMSVRGLSEYSGNFDSAYTVNTTSMTTGGPAPANGKSNTIIEAKWMGPCKPDQKPGDIIMQVDNRPDATIKMNIRDNIRDAMKADAMKAKGSAAALAQEDPPLTDCDTYAASDSDPDPKAPGLHFTQIDPKKAVPACEDALSRYPNSLRFQYQLGRAYLKNGEGVKGGELLRDAVAKGFLGGCSTTEPYTCK